MAQIRSVLFVVILALLLIAVRWLLPGLPANYAGPLAIVEPVFALGLLALLLLLAGSLGWKALHWLALTNLSGLEQAVMTLPLGLGMVAYGVLALGLAGFLRPVAIFIWLLAVGVWTHKEWSTLVSGLPRWVSGQLGTLRKLGCGERAVLAVAALLLIATLLHALTPPWDYDGLMYHLTGPQLFLQAGRILLLPDLWQANGPLTTEMLFTIGLAWGSDILAKLIHLTYGIWLMLATFAFGQRFQGQKEGWTAIALMFGVPLLPMVSSEAYVDVTWALYEFLSLYAISCWQEKRDRRWLLAAGLMMGAALGSKYLALGGLGVLGLWVLWQERRAGGREALASVMLLGLPAILVAFPWYAKNWFLSGNPFYPFILGGTGWTSDRLGQLMEYLNSFGVGRSLSDYLLLPWNLYTQNKRFGTINAAFDIPGLLFPLATLYVLRPRDRIMNSIACLSAMRFLVWAVGSQQTRFLLPIFPPLALLGASVLVWAGPRLRNRWQASRPLLLLLTGSPILFTLFLQAAFCFVLPPTSVLLGLESRDDFLHLRVVNHSAVRFVQANLSDKERVMMMWDGRAYYCDARCLPDADQSNWTRLVNSESNPVSVAAHLRSAGITHLLLNEQDAEFFLGHDPAGRHRQALEFFLQAFRPACTEELYRDDIMTLVRVTCDP